jgi:hypothetical protein
MISLLKIVSVYLILILLLQGCATPIKKIYRSPEKYHNKDVKVKGRVISSLQLIDLLSFTIKDRTGKIMIVTKNLLPLKNDKVKVHGQVDRNFKYKEQNTIVIVEKKLKLQKMKDAKMKIEKL